MTYLPQNWRGTETYHNDTFVLDGFDFFVSAEYDETQRPAAPSFKYDPTTGIFRFTVRDGDTFTSSRFSDLPPSERAEISMSPRWDVRPTFNGNGVYASAKFEFRIPAGVPANTAAWMSIFQFHSGINRSGPFDMGPRGSDQLKGVVRSSLGETVYNLTPGPITRDHWYQVKIDIKFDPDTSGGNTGYIHIWIDGTLVLDLNNIRIGYTDQTTTHNNMGCYRNSPPGNETWITEIRNVDITYSATLAGSNHGAPSYTPPTWEAPAGATVVNGTTGNDQILLGSTQKAAYGQGGSDIFVFNAMPAAPHYLMDFDPANDRIEFRNDVFTSLWALDPIGADTFRAGTAAADHNDHVIYDSATGTLWYDSDGDGAAAKVEIARLQPGTSLNNSHFRTVAPPPPVQPALQYNQDTGELFYDSDINSGSGFVLQQTFPAGTPLTFI